MDALKGNVNNDKFVDAMFNMSNGKENSHNRDTGIDADTSKKNAEQIENLSNFQQTR